LRSWTVSTVFGTFPRTDYRYGAVIYQKALEKKFFKENSFIELSFSNFYNFPSDLKKA
jgi:hypothetical protein